MAHYVVSAGSLDLSDGTIDWKYFSDDIQTLSEAIEKDRLCSDYPVHHVEYFSDDGSVYLIEYKFEGWSVAQ